MDQVRLVRRIFLEALGESKAPLIEVNSVDGFQGREKQIIIFCTVRSDHKRDEPRGIGFVKDARRINVSMTRAKHTLLILGHAKTLRKEEIWDSLIRDAEQRKCVLKAHSPIGIWFESASKEMAAVAETGAAADTNSSTNTDANTNADANVNVDASTVTSAVGLGVRQGEDNDSEQQPKRSRMS
eukprot:2342820-Pleurochrysis_carterae.AAC.4